MNKKVLYPVLVVVAGLAVALLMVLNQPTVEPEPYTPLPTTVRVTRAASGTEYLTVNSQGTVQPRSQSELIPEVSGRVEWISPALVSGGSFQRDEVLLRIEDADYRSTLARSEAALQRAEVEYEYASDELKRLESLRGRQLASQQQLDNASRAARVAEANLGESRANLDQARRDLERTELRAPFDGLVRSEQVDLGQFITRGQSIGTIYATDYIEIRLPIATDQLGYLGLAPSTRGEIPDGLRPPVTVTAELGNTRFTREGELMRLEAEIDERSRMVYGVARLKVDAGGLPVPVGLFVEASIKGRKVEGVIRLPRSAMRDDNQVLVVDDDDRLRFRQVKVLRLEHDEMLISDGLAEGEMVCISPLQTVVEGMQVEPVLEAEAAQ